MPLAEIIHDQCEIEDSALNAQIALHNSLDRPQSLLVAGLATITLLLCHQILSPLLFVSWILDPSDPNTVSANAHKIGGQIEATSPTIR